MAFQFERRVPPGSLARFVDCVWFARGRIPYRREHIAPTGATVAVLNLGSPILHSVEGREGSCIRAVEGWITGPHDQPSLNEPAAETHCYGVVSTPVGCEALFGLPPRELRGRVVPIARWQRGRSLRTELIGLAPRLGLAHLLAALEADRSTVPPRIDRVERVVAWLDDDPTLNVGEIARRLGLSHAHLDREFTRIVGLGPRRLAAILRVRHLLRELDVRKENNWSEMAAAYGWYDQSHFVRDFKRYTGATPTAYVLAQRTHFDASERADASGFVPYGEETEVESVQDGRPSAC